MSEMLNLREAANYAGVTHAAIRQWLNRVKEPLPALAVTKDGEKLVYRQARIQGKKIVAILIAPADLDNYQPSKGGRPQKSASLSN